MSKLLRKMTIIALVSVLVLGVSVSASAATQWEGHQKYDDDKYAVDAFAYIRESYAYGELSVGDSEATDVRVSIEVTYNYLNNDPYSGVQTDFNSDTQYGIVGVSCSGSQIVAMVDATYTFEAEFPLHTLLSPYRADSVYLRYWPQ